MIATEKPAAATRSAVAKPAGPAPAMTRSKFPGLEGSRRGKFISGKRMVGGGGAVVAGASGTPTGAAAAAAAETTAVCAALVIKGRCRRAERELPSKAPSRAVGRLTW